MPSIDLTLQSDDMEGKRNGDQRRSTSAAAVVPGSITRGLIIFGVIVLKYVGIKIIHTIIIFT